MVKIEGLYNTAFCYTPILEDAARAQIQSVCDQKEFAGCKIRIMLHDRYHHDHSGQDRSGHGRR